MITSAHVRQTRADTARLSFRLPAGNSTWPAAAAWRRASAASSPRAFNWKYGELRPIKKYNTVPVTSMPSQIRYEFVSPIEPSAIGMSIEKMPGAILPTPPNTASALPCAFFEYQYDTWLIPTENVAIPHPHSMASSSNSG